MGSLRHGRIGAIGAVVGIRQYTIAPRQHCRTNFLCLCHRWHVCWCAGALVSLSYYLPAFIAYVYASALPLAWSFLLDGRTVYVAMGCMALVFAAAVTFAAHHFNRAFVSGFRLNVDLAKRTEDLTHQTEELTAVIRDWKQRLLNGKTLRVSCTRHRNWKRSGS